ncbi:hypothetical protein Kuja_1280 [Vibrio phage vB_VchM_Kuja]|uniref:Uncharacterized protein n=1 Tax=Vibrio phage vB_VchM_Kuja TaxID=2686437 RepID=A0A6B9J9H3_9CAUD|nr:hypothetical protein HWC83_gp108 [Vibrio phage vB_VchM_Kuja]QGZ16119.1 hypothetical protein Kuja_1280 [Vibrio phage vB_VchM_Kuja]
MFDANAAYIQIGEKFFAEVHESNEQLELLGVKRGMIVLCEHVSILEDTPRFPNLTKIWLQKDSEPVEYQFNYSHDYAWLVYSGRPNGHGFINEKWKAKAFEFMLGAWELNQG